MVLSKVLPDGKKLAYRYHETGPNNGTLMSISQQKSFGRQTPIVEQIDLERRDGDVGWTSHNGLRTDIQLSAGGQVLQMNTPSIQNIEYQYGAKNRVTVADHDGLKTRYNYSFGRLVATESANESHVYEYDALGNRRAHYAYKPMLSQLQATEYHYGENSHGNRLMKTVDIATSAEMEWHYSAGGAPVNNGVHRYTYDSERRPIELYEGSTLVARYRYNGFGERVSKTVFNTEAQPVTTYFLYDNEKLSAEAGHDGEVTRQYIYLQSHRPVALLGTDSISAIHTDKLGTPQAMSDEQGQLVWSARYTPFGVATVMVEERTLPLRFPGQYADAESGTHYNYYRDYDPTLGRYTTSDPIGLAGGDNTYAYALLNPVSFIDVLGLFAIGDSISESQLQNMNGNPAAIRAWVQQNLSSFADRNAFYLWANERLNSEDSQRQTDWFLAAAQVNEEDALGAMELPGTTLAGLSSTRDYLLHAGSELAVQNVQTFISLFFREFIAGVDGLSNGSQCDGTFLEGNALDEALVPLEQNELQIISDSYFSSRPEPLLQDAIFFDINGIMNGNTMVGFFAGFVGDENTEMVVNRFWPNDDFDINNVEHRIRLGTALVRINNNEPWQHG